MEYCSSYNGIAYQHSPQHTHEIRNGYDSGLYGHNQHINYGMHHNHHHHHHQQQQHHHHHPQYGSNRNVYTDAYKANLAQNYHQPLPYANNFESSYEPTTSATVPPSSATFRSNRFVGYQCEMQQCFPVNGSQDNHRGEYTPLNSSISRCLDPLANHIGLPDPRSHSHNHNHHHHHHPHHQQQQPYGHETIAHHAPHSMRMPLGYRTYDSIQQKMMSRPSFENDQWYGYSNESPHHHYPNHHPQQHPNHHQHHHPHQQQQQQQHHHHSHSNSNSEYTPHMHGHNGNPYSTSANGQLATAKEDKALKMHRDRSLSKLVAMNRRLETQMNESERNDPFLYDHHLENFDYYTDFSETPESITSSSQFTNNDSMINNVTTSEPDNNNNIDGAPNNGHKNNCKELNNQMGNDSTERSEWLSTVAITSTTTASTSIATTTTLKDSTITTAAANVTCTESKNENLNSDSKVSNENEQNKKNDLPSANAVNKPSAKLNTNKKNAKSKKMTYGNTMEKRRKRREKKPNIHFEQIKDSKVDTIPLPTLPGFAEAFGSTEIGRFSEIFFNASGSPIEIFESEADTLSPQPWEMGDSLEGPHFSMQTNNTPLSYTESLGSTDSPTASNNSFFSELRASDF